MQVGVEVDRELEEGLFVVVPVDGDGEVVDDGAQQVHAERVVRRRPQGVLEVDVQLVHAGRVVDVGHHLVRGHPRLLPDLLAAGVVQPHQHGDVLAPQVADGPQAGVDHHREPVEGRPPRPPPRHLLPEEGRRLEPLVESMIFFSYVKTGMWFSHPFS